MPNYYFADGDNARYNRATIVGDSNLYNAVLSIDETIITGVEPVSLDEAKRYLRIAFTDYDTELELMITAVREAIEQYTGLSLIEKVITATLNNSRGGIELPYGPVIMVTNVQDRYGNTVASYELHGSSFKTLHYNSSYVIVTYTAGYTIAPKSLRLAILTELTYRYENRGDTKNEGLSAGAKALSGGFKRITWLV